jgi:hypothetical protein
MLLNSAIPSLLSASLEKSKDRPLGNNTLLGKLHIFLLAPTVKTFFTVAVGEDKLPSNIHMHSKQTILSDFDFMT